MVLPEVRVMASELRGERLVLRECNPLDLPPIPFDFEGAFLDPHVGKVEEPIYFAIWLGSEFIGDCVIYNRDGNEVEFGIKISLDYRDKGYGSEATKIISDYCLTTMGYTKVHLKVLPHNARAIRSYEKAGFRRCGKIVIDGVEFVKMERMK
jgi:RimJ/RimL family protein N-acetyltransferase